MESGVHGIDETTCTKIRGISVASKEFIQKKLAEDSEITAKKVLIVEYNSLLKLNYVK